MVHPHGRLSEEFLAAAIHCGVHRRHQPRISVGAPRFVSVDQMFWIYSRIHPIHSNKSVEIKDHEKRTVRSFKLKNLKQSSTIFNKEAFNKLQDVQRCLSIAFRCFKLPFCAEIRPQRRGCSQWHRSFTRRDAEREESGNP